MNDYDIITRIKVEIVNVASKIPLEKRIRDYLRNYSEIDIIDMSKVKKSQNIMI